MGRVLTHSNISAGISVACTLFFGSFGDYVPMQTWVHNSSLAEIAQLVEHVHGKDEVVGSIPTLGSRIAASLLF